MTPTVGETTVTLDRTPDGRRLVVSRSVDATVTSVWDVLRDTEQWPVWGPSVSAVRCADRYVERGTTGQVQVFGGPWLPFEVGTCRPHRWTWDVARIEATGHFVSERDAGTVVGFELPPLASGYAPVCARACRIIADIAE